MNSKGGQALKKMSREDLILLIRDLTAENEKLRAERAAAPAPEAPDKLKDASLTKEIRGLRDSIDALRGSLDNWCGKGQR